MTLAAPIQRRSAERPFGVEKKIPQVPIAPHGTIAGVSSCLNSAREWQLRSDTPSGIYVNFGVQNKTPLCDNIITRECPSRFPRWMPPVHLRLKLSPERLSWQRWQRCVTSALTSLMCERMLWHDGQRFFPSVMKTGTNLIYSFLSGETKDLYIPSWERSFPFNRRSLGDVLLHCCTDWAKFPCEMNADSGNN